MMKPNPYGEWATRVGTIGKGEEDHQQMFKSLRVPADDRPINKRAVPYTYTMPDGQRLCYRVSTVSNDRRGGLQHRLLVADVNAERAEDGSLLP